MEVLDARPPSPSSSLSLSPSASASAAQPQSHLQPHPQASPPRGQALKNAQQDVQQMKQQHKAELEAKDKEVQAQRTAGHIAEDEKAAADADAQVVAEYDVTTWDYVSSKAITEEYMQSMFQCVSSI